MKKGTNKKKRFDKKNAVRFKIVPRDADDPVANDPTSSKFVLQPVGSDATAEVQAKILKGLPQEYLRAEEPDHEEMFQYLPNHGGGFKYLDKRKENGISNVAHDYDYSQHLREIGGGTFVPTEGYAVEADPRMKMTKGEVESPGLVSPAASKAANSSAEQEKKSSSSSSSIVQFVLPVGPEIINDKKKRVKNPNVRATHDFYDALEGDNAQYEYEDLLDDFIQVACGNSVPEHYKAAEEDSKKGGGGDIEVGTDEKCPSAEDLSDVDKKIAAMMAAGMTEDDLDFDEDEDDEEEEMLRRRRLDAHFASLYAEFEDENLGEIEQLDEGLEYKDIEHHLEQEISQRAENLKVQQDMDKNTKEILKEKICETVERLQEEAAKDVKEIEKEIMDSYKPKPKEKWDCESILSTYSSASNHPSMIREPRRNRIKQIKTSKEEKSEKRQDYALEEDDELESVDEYEPVNLGVRRSKKESKAERKARKDAAKARKKEARLRKKGTKNLFKKEREIVNRNRINNQVANPVGIRL